MTPQHYTEQNFEEHIEEHLLNSGYHRQDTEKYDKNLCLIPEEVIFLIQSSQPDEFEELKKQYGADTAKKLVYRLSQEVNKYGTLQVIRKGFKDRGVKFRLAFFKPSSGMNPEHQKLYEQNRFAVVRQLKFSDRDEKSLDMVIFLNGLPIITMELKNSLTGQFVENAIKQYKKDRDPREPLFKFKRCLVHFAVGNEKIFMTTRLQGEKTKFLPFNKDTENPVNPNGHKTAYLWEDILQPVTLLNLIQNYLHIQINTEKLYDPDKKKVVEIETPFFIFPRFHQLDVVRKILSAVKSEGTGHNYLVQHSTGSGKSNSIAWLAHQLASFYQHETDEERLFDSIIVVTDRRVLDRQLQNTIKQFEQVEGVVKKIDVNSTQLQQALETGKDIIVSTLQKFPVISESMSKLEGRRFAVIIDEAHSSQSGESSKHLKKVLSVNLDKAEEEDRDDSNLEDEVVKEIKYRGPQKHISYFAFTATPKNKTLELFGRKNQNRRYIAFHVYSMRQAIEENFILDVLENYTTFERYFKLVKTLKEDKEYEKKKAVNLLKNWVDLQPHAIEMKTRIMLDHFLDVTVNAIQGRGRAMVATCSRLHVVKFYFMFKKIMAEKGLQIKPLAAFSGTVKDSDTGLETTENGLNKLPPKVSIEDAFKMPKYRILIVANKFQTGFDEPYLHTMYVDKKLGGVNAVQTLGRLNRPAKGKTKTAILDFINDIEDIQAAFQDFYQTTLLEGETDPNKLHDYENELEECEVYTKTDIENFANIFYNPSEPEEKLQPILDHVVTQWQFIADENKREDFRSLLQSYIRLYGFVSQMISYQDTDLEKLYVFAKHLNSKLPKRKVSLPHEIRDAVDLASFRIEQTYEGDASLKKKDGIVKPISDGTSQHEEEEKELLSNIIKFLNETYNLNLTEENQIDLENIKVKLENDEELLAVMNEKNTLSAIKYKFDKILENLLLEFVHTKLDLYKKLTDPKVYSVFKDRLFEGYKEQFEM